MVELEIPADVAEFAASVGGKPIAWHYGELSVTIVMEDGRKLHFPKGDAIPRGDAIPAEPARKAFVSAQRESMEKARRSKSHAGKE